MEIWQRLVHIIVGELTLDKSSFAIMAWKIAAGTEKLCTIKDTPGSVNLRSEKYTGHEIYLKRIEVHTAERQLGVRLATDGNDTAEYTHRLQQSKLLAGKVAYILQPT